MGGFQTKLGLLTLVVVCLAIVAPASAVPYTLVDNGSSVTIDPQSQQGVSNWTVEGIGYNLFQEWFWVRVGDAAGTGQTSLDAISSVSTLVAPEVLRTIFTGNGYSIEMYNFLTGGGAGTAPTSDLAQTITIHNNTGKTLHFFQYADFDLRGDPSNDLVTVLNANAVLQTKLGASVTLSEAVVGPAPAVWQTDFYANILNSLNSGSNFDLTATPVGVTKGPGDMTWAAEWNFAPGTTIISKDLRLVVPEPVTMFSAFMAISGLGMYMRKRTRVA